MSYRLVEDLKKPKRKNFPFLPISGYYAIRWLLYTDAQKSFKNLSNWFDSRLLNLVDLNSEQLEVMEMPNIIDHLQAQLDHIEASGALDNLDLLTNTRMLQQHLQLTDTERDFLQFLILLQEDRNLSVCNDYFENMNSTRILEDISQILGHSMKDLADATSPGSNLLKSGLVNRARYSCSTPFRLEVLENLGFQLMTRRCEIMELFQRFFFTAPAPRLSLPDFDYIQQDLQIIQQLIDAAIKTRQGGVNILLHGLPGTGKTELARVVAKSLGIQLYEVSSVDRDGDPLRGPLRFNACYLAQQILANNERHLLLFDEIEDVFPQKDAFPFYFRDDTSKAWVNRLLENNRIPVIWISNNIEDMDPAYLRRFNVVLEVPRPSDRVRRHMVEQALNKTALSEGFKHALATSPTVTPGHIDMLARTAQLLARAGGQAAEADVHRIITHNLHAQGDTMKNPEQQLFTLPYRDDILNADYPLPQLIDGLRQLSAGRIGLYGPPGTGKTAYARYVADTLQKTLVRKNASDLISKYVGETEKNIARAFREATSSQAILLIDEVDSFLAQRDSALHPWEVSQVNELLTQVDQFEGILFCTTNRLEALDPAILRRLDLKIHLDYLTTDQAWQLFITTQKQLGNKLLKKQKTLLQQRLSALTHLAPGDFAVAVSQLRFSARRQHPEYFVELLEKEVSLKPDNRHRSIGFIQ